MSTEIKSRRASDMTPTEGPRCPSCGEYMEHHGGSIGYLHCGWKLLYRAGGWVENGEHVKDDRLAGGTRRVDGTRI